MARQLILLTGATSQIGFPTLARLLEAGYCVRAPTRSIVKAKEILSHHSLAALNPLTSGQLELLEIPDITAPGSYDNAVKGCSTIIHLASPTIASFVLEKAMELSTFFDPAVCGTLNLLSAAKQANSVKRVIIASAIFALLPHTDLATGSYPAVVDTSSRTQPTGPPYSDVYAANGDAKIRALNAAEDWIASQKPHFEVVHIFPGFVIGKSYARANIPDGGLLGGNRAIIGPVSKGKDASLAVPTVSVHIDDVAMALLVLTEKEKTGTTGLILKSGGLEGTQWEDAQGVVMKEFGVMIDSGILPKPGRVTSALLKVDAGHAEKFLGFQLKGFDEQVKSAVGWYLEGLLSTLC